MSASTEFTSTFWRPKFGDKVRGVYASETNPIRDGMFVELIIRRGILNNGRWYRLTDGNGRFWEFREEDCIATPPLTARPGGETL